MRLLNAKTRKLCSFLEDDAPPYAILSHTWGSEEVTFIDIQSTWPLYRRKKGWPKIKWCCRQALKDQIEYVWVDTCCIDKSSSSELQEAINSMYRWYENSNICYAYLVDVSSGEDPSAVDSGFRKSRWHTRGWTLQELLAPDEIIFFDASWKEVGTRYSLQNLISLITGIDGDVFYKPDSISHKSFRNACSIAQKMSWAAGRSTTRPEDMAYCLLGIFEINMPLLYGEGEKAFIRLQEEIMKSSEDQTILAWGLGKPLSGYLPRALATSPNDFSECTHLVSFGVLEAGDSFSMTQRGLALDLPIVDLYGDGNILYCLLNCSMGSWESNHEMVRILALPLLRSNSMYDASNSLTADVYIRLTLATPVWITTKCSRGRQRKRIYLARFLKYTIAPIRDYLPNRLYMALKDIHLPGNYFVASVWPPALTDADMKVIRYKSKSSMDDCCMIHIARPSQPGFMIIIRYPNRDFPMVGLVEEDANKSFLDYLLNSEVLQRTWARMHLKNRSIEAETLSSLVWSQLDGSPITLQVSLEIPMYDMRKGLSLRLTSSVDEEVGEPLVGVAS